VGARDVQPEAGAVARGLRREEGIEDLAPMLGRDAGAVVDDAYDQRMALGLGGDGHLCAEVDRVEGIVEDVHPHLFQLAADRIHARQSRRDVDLQAQRLVPSLVAQDHERVPQAPVMSPACHSMTLWRLAPPSRRRRGARSARPPARRPFRRD
jgi:hypothetical protein